MARHIYRKVDKIVCDKEYKCHSHENTKAVVNRLSRAIGHLEAVKKMVE